MLVLLMLMVVLMVEVLPGVVVADTSGWKYDIGTPWCRCC